MNSRNTVIIVATLFTILAAFTLINGNMDRIAAVLRTYHLLPEPEPLTELYFADHLNLPKTATRSQELKVAFSLHNIEYKPMNYKYEITAESTEAGKLFLTEGSVLLDHDAEKTVSENIKIGSISGRTKIEVNLVDQKQPIHFWVNVY